MVVFKFVKVAFELILEVFGLLELMPEFCYTIFEFSDLQSPLEVLFDDFFLFFEDMVVKLSNFLEFILLFGEHTLVLVFEFLYGHKLYF